LARDGQASLPSRFRDEAGRSPLVRGRDTAAVAWKLIDENPAKKAGKKPQPKAREIHPLTVEELARVVGEVGAHGRSSPSQRSQDCGRASG
jgi:hypothetical protein